MLLLMQKIVFFSAVTQMGIGLLLTLEGNYSEHLYLHSKLFLLGDNYMTTAECTSFRKLSGPKGHDHIVTAVLNHTMHPAILLEPYALHLPGRVSRISCILGLVNAILPVA